MLHYNCLLHNWDSQADYLEVWRARYCQQNCTSIWMGRISWRTLSNGTAIETIQKKTNNKIIHNTFLFSGCATLLLQASHHLNHWALFGSFFTLLGGKKKKKQKLFVSVSANPYPRYGQLGGQINSVNTRPGTKSI